MMPWTADVAEPIRVFVLHHFADQFGAVGAQARDDVVDTIDGEHDAADPECVHRNVLGPSSDRFRRVELIQLDPSVAVRSAHQREGSTDVLKADETIYRGAFDGRFALQLHTKLDKERLRSLKVVNHDEDVVHPPNCHGRSPSSSRGPSWPLVYLGRSQHHILDIRHDNPPRHPTPPPSRLWSSQNRSVRVTGQPVEEPC